MAASGAPARDSATLRDIESEVMRKIPIAPRAVLIAGTLAAVLFPCLAMQAAQPTRRRTLNYDAKQRSWAEQPPPSPGTPAGDLREIRLMIQDQAYRKARRAIKKFVKNHGQDSSLYPDVLLARADALIAQRSFKKAHRLLQSFLNEFGGGRLTDEALRLQFIMAEDFLAGAKRKFLGLRVLSGQELAYEILDQIATDYPESRMAELALKTKADHLFGKGEHALAELDYARLLEGFPQSQYLQYGMRRTADAALASYRGVDYDESALIEAEERYKDYQSRFATSAKRENVGLVLDSIQENKAEKEFSIGAYYDRTKHLSSAVFYYQSTVAQWPGTSAAFRATRRLQLLGSTLPAESATGG